MFIPGILQREDRGDPICLCEKSTEILSIVGIVECIAELGLVHPGKIPVPDGTGCIRPAIHLQILLLRECVQICFQISCNFGGAEAVQMSRIPKILPAVKGNFILKKRKINDVDSGIAGILCDGVVNRAVVLRNVIGENRKDKTEALLFGEPDHLVQPFAVAVGERSRKAGIRAGGAPGYVVVLPVVGRAPSKVIQRIFQKVVGLELAVACVNDGPAKNEILLVFFLRIGGDKLYGIGGCPHGEQVSVDVSDEGMLLKGERIEIGEYDLRLLRFQKLNQSMIAGVLVLAGNCHVKGGDAAVLPHDGRIDAGIAVAAAKEGNVNGILRRVIQLVVGGDVVAGGILPADHPVNARQHQGGKKDEKDDISIRSKSAVFIHIKDHFFVSEFHAVQPRQIPGNFRRQKRNFVRSRRR